MASHGSFAGIVVGVLLVYNIVSNEVLDQRFHPALAVATALGLVGAARHLGLGALELGVARQHARTGVRTGLVMGLAVSACVLVLALLPPTRSSFVDPAFLDRGAATVAWNVLVRIPFVTAGFEELAFRGVLFSTLQRTLSLRAAVLVQAALFGLWHILPTHGPGVGWVEIATSVGFTTFAGVVFSLVQLRSGSLLAPTILHWFANGAAYTAAWIVTN